jgi:hypothetical protein
MDRYADIFEAAFLLLTFHIDMRYCELVDARNTRMEVVLDAYIKDGIEALLQKDQGIPGGRMGDPVKTFDALLKTIRKEQHQAKLGILDKECETMFACGIESCA